MPKLKLPSILCFTAFNLIWVLGSGLLYLSSCSPNARVQGRGIDELQGEWQQNAEPVHQKLVEYTLYQFRFTCDSFYVAMQTHSKINYGADTCLNRGRWTEYAKGQYEQRNDTLHLRGFFCLANYRLKNTGGCLRAGVYEDYFKIVKQSDSVASLTPTSGVLAANLHLIKRTNCVPKPL
jgi:hypothetical protein